MPHDFLLEHDRKAPIKYSAKSSGFPGPPFVWTHHAEMNYGELPIEGQQSGCMLH